MMSRNGRNAVPFNILKKRSGCNYPLFIRKWLRRSWLSISPGYWTRLLSSMGNIHECFDIVKPSIVYLLVAKSIQPWIGSILPSLILVSVSANVLRYAKQKDVTWWYHPIRHYGIYKEFYKKGKKNAGVGLDPERVHPVKQGLSSFTVMMAMSLWNDKIYKSDYRRLKGRLQPDVRCDEKYYHFPDETIDDIWAWGENYEYQSYYLPVNTVFRWMMGKRYLITAPWKGKTLRDFTDIHVCASPFFNTAMVSCSKYSIEELQAIWNLSIFHRINQVAKKVISNARSIIRIQISKGKWRPLLGIAEVRELKYIVASQVVDISRYDPQQEDTFVDTNVVLAASQIASQGFPSAGKTDQNLSRFY